MSNWKFIDEESKEPEAKVASNPIENPETATPVAAAPVAPRVPTAPNVEPPRAPTAPATPQAPVAPGMRPVQPAPSVPAPNVPVARTPQVPATPNIPAAPVAPASKVAAPAPPNARPQVPQPGQNAASTPRPPAGAPRSAPPPPHMVPRAGQTPGAAVPQPPSAQAPLVQAPAPQVAPGSAGVHMYEEKPQWRQYLDKLDPVAFWLFRMAGLAGSLALVWLLFSIFGGGAGTLAANDPRLAQVTNDMRIAATIVHWSLIFIALSLIILMLDVAWIGPSMAVLGVLLHFGGPLALKAIGQTSATVAVAKILQTTGFWLLFLGLSKYSIDLMRWIIDLPSRMKAKANVGVAQKAEVAQQRVAREATMFSPCWKLPYCREVIRKQCPAYLAKKRCWKFGRGCYCDEEMISRIIRGESLDVIKAPTRQSRQGKPPCGRCHIFLEHQGLKYKMLSPLAIPGTIIGMYVIWPFYTSAFTALSNRLDFFWNRLSINPSQLAPEAVRARPDIEVTTTGMSPEQISYYASVMFGVMLGFFVLIYISKFIEWAVFKAKL
jgi:hypothetical protein